MDRKFEASRCYLNSKRHYNKSRMSKWIAGTTSRGNKSIRARRVHRYVRHSIRQEIKEIIRHVGEDTTSYDMPVNLSSKFRHRYFR